MNALETKVLELIGESVTAPDVFTDDSTGLAQIRDSLNDAIGEIIMLTGGNKRQYFLPMREDQMFYRIRLDRGTLGWITDVWDVNRQNRLEQTDLIRLNNHDPRWMIPGSFPESYLQIGADVIGFYPKPSSSSSVMELTIVEIPEPYAADNDPIKLRESFKYAAIHYAVSEFWASRGDANEATTHLGEYLQALGLKDKYMPQSQRVSGLRTEKEHWPRVTS